MSRILKMFHTNTATKPPFICVNTLDECVPQHWVVILESLGQIMQASLGTRIFVTGISNVRSEVERKLDREATFVLIEPTGDGIVRYLPKKLKNDTTPDMMSNTLEADIIERIPERSSETYLEPTRQKITKVENLRPH